MSIVNHFVDDCTHLTFLPLILHHRPPLEVRVQLLHLGLIISTLEIALANILRDVLVLVSTLEIALANILRDVLVLVSTLEIVLANTSLGCTRTFRCVHQCNKVYFPYLFCFYVPSLWPPFIPFSLFIWNQHCLG